jgi:hypothetical protein
VVAGLVGELGVDVHHVVQLVADVGRREGACGVQGLVEVLGVDGRPEGEGLGTQGWLTAREAVGSRRVDPG